MLAYPNFPSCFLTSILNVRGACSTWMGPIRIGPRALFARLNGAPATNCMADSVRRAPYLAQIWAAFAVGVDNACPPSVFLIPCVRD
jgi:hypothetical protein